jgi:hypothetical protein
MLKLEPLFRKCTSSLEALFLDADEAVATDPAVGCEQILARMFPSATSWIRTQQTCHSLIERFCMFLVIRWC